MRYRHALTNYNSLSRAPQHLILHSSEPGFSLKNAQSPDNTSSKSAALSLQYYQPTDSTCNLLLQQDTTSYPFAHSGIRCFPSLRYQAAKCDCRSQTAQKLPSGLLRAGVAEGGPGQGWLGRTASRIPEEGPDARQIICQRPECQHYAAP